MGRSITRINFCNKNMIREALNTKKRVGWSTWALETLGYVVVFQSRLSCLAGIYGFPAPDSLYRKLGSIRKTRVIAISVELANVLA